MAALSRTQTIALARSFKGISESPAYSNNVVFSRWYGMIGPWCAMYVSYVLYHSGHRLPIRTYKGFSYCPDVVNWAQKNGRWTTSRSQAKPGDLILFSFGGRRADHIGFVAGRLPDGRMVTIEGNTGSNNRDGGSVQERHRNSGIIGFVRLDYPSAPPPIPAWPKLTRTLKYGVPPGNDIAIWKMYMILLGVGPEFAGMDAQQLSTFGKTTSPRVAYRWKVLWNGIHDLHPGDDGYLTPDYTVGAKTWQTIIFSVATKK